MTILAASDWSTNAALIADVWTLHVVPRFGDMPAVLDPTYGRGLWWPTVRQAYGVLDIVAHDLRGDGVDFRHLPHPDASFDVVAFDPPYVCVGGRRTTTIRDMHDRYGLTDTPSTPHALHDMNMAGLDEARRVIRRRGLALVKCQDYVTSGRLWPETHYTLEHALLHGWSLVDRLEHIGHRRPQPTDDKCRQCIDGTISTWDPERREYVDGPCDRCGGVGRIPRRQVHARRNLSTLFVLQAS